MLAATDLAEVWPRGATPCLRSGEVAERKYSMSEVRGGGQEELPHVQRLERQLRVPGCDGAGAADRSYCMPEARGSHREEQPHVQGTMAARAQERLEELFHV